jgi:hypothetical protein
MPWHILFLPSYRAALYFVLVLFAIFLILGSVLVKDANRNSKLEVPYARLCEEKY